MAARHDQTGLGATALWYVPHLPALAQSHLDARLALFISESSRPIQGAEACGDGPPQPAKHN